MIRIAFCDDDLIYINTALKPLVSQALKRAEIQAEVCFFIDGNGLLKEFREHRDFDIVILDIDMPKLNGKTLAERLRELNSGFTLAFVTAFSNEAINTIPYSIKAFIPKDVSEDKMLKALVKLFKDCSAQYPRYRVFEIIRDRSAELIRLSDDDIFYFQNRFEHIYLYTKAEQFLLTERSIKRLEQRYDLTGFCRIHTDLIVNIGKVYEIMKNDIVLTNGMKLPVSRRRRNDLISAFADLMTTKVGK